MTSPAELFDLTGRPAIVTGAAGHLGRVIARTLASAGAPTWLVGRTRRPLEELAAEIRAVGGEATVQCTDVTSNVEVEKLADVVRERYGRVDVLVSNAHVGRGGTLRTASEADLQEATDLALGATHRLIRAMRPLLAVAAEDGSPSVVGIASMYGMVSPRHDIYENPQAVNPPFYGAAKAGLIQLCRYAAVELSADRIRVNTISPGPFPVDPEPDFESRLSHLVPARRTGRADEIATAVLYLASPFSSYTTGSNLVVDGGWTAW